jgi:DNA-directed RNA polymerase omega subunit
MINNKYLLAMMVASRAKELTKGDKPLVKSKYKQPIFVALEEIRAGKVYLKEKEEPLREEQIFNEVEEPAKSEDISDETKESEEYEELSDETEGPEEIEELFERDEETEKPENLFD